MQPMIRNACLATATLAPLLIAGAVLGDSITLKNSVRLQSRNDAIRLADIAELEGPEALRHADLVVLESTDATAAFEIEIQQVRQVLDQAHVHWGRVDLNGRRTIVRPAPASGATPPLAMTGVTLTGVKEPESPTRKAQAPVRDEINAQHMVSANTLGGGIARLITGGLNIRPADLRLSLDRNDSDFLDLDSSASDPRFEINPLSSLDSDRLTLEIRTWSGGKIIQSRNVTVHPHILTETVTLRRNARRNEPIAEGDLELTREWLPPSQAMLRCRMAETVGKLASRSLRSGDILRKSDIKRPTLIDRGNRVIVRCLVGGVVISMQAEARSEGAEGDQIELRKLGERDTFFAIVTGPGEAVVDLTS